MDCCEGVRAGDLPRGGSHPCVLCLCALAFLFLFVCCNQVFNTTAQNSTASSTSPNDLAAKTAALCKPNLALANRARRRVGGPLHHEALTTDNYSQVLHSVLRTGTNPDGGSK